MRRTRDIREVAKVLLAAGYKPVFDTQSLPPDLAAIQKLKGSPGSDFIDELGFVEEKDALRLYLRHRIDLAWLATRIELLPPLKVDEPGNAIYGDWVEICGGSEEPPLQT